MGLLASAHENGGTRRGFGLSNRATLAGKSWMHFLMLDDGLTGIPLLLIYTTWQGAGGVFFLSSFSVGDMKQFTLARVRQRHSRTCPIFLDIVTIFFGNPRLMRSLKIL